MRSKLCPRKRILLCWVAALGLQGAGSSAFAATACAGTPAVAIGFTGTESLALPMPEGKGYRVTGVRWDPLLRQSWATVVSCGHPEWPGFSLRMNETNQASRGLGAKVGEEHAPAAPVVHAGDIVQLWRQEDLLRIEVAGVAEESGSLGETIRVRLLRGNGSDQSTEEQFKGIVHGRSNVEMRP
jgi:hypothetical protein